MLKRLWYHFYYLILFDCWVDVNSNCNKRRNKTDIKPWKYFKDSLLY